MKIKYLLLTFIFAALVPYNTYALQGQDSNGTCNITNIEDLRLEIQNNENKLTSDINSLEIKKQNLEALYGQAKEGQDVWNEISLLEDEIFYLKAGIVSLELSILELKIFEEYVYSNYTTSLNLDISEKDTIEIQIDMLISELSQKRWRLRNLFANAQEGNVSWNEIITNQGRNKFYKRADK